MNNITNIIKMHSNCSGFDTEIPTAEQRLSQTEKDRSIKKGVTNKPSCLILLPCPPQTASEGAFWSTSPHLASSEEVFGLLWALSSFAACFGSLCRIQ